MYVFFLCQLLVFTTATEKFDETRSDFKYLDHLDIDPATEQTVSINVALPLKTRRNGTLYLHVFLTKRSHGADWRSALNDETTTYTAAQITQYQVPVQHTFNLLRDSVVIFFYMT